MRHRGFSEHITAAVTAVTKDRLDRFPPLIVYTCLAAAHEALSASALTSIQMGGAAKSEVLTMPRRTFGVRPIEVLSPTARTVYHALALALADCLADSSRGQEEWEAHRRFGLTGDHSHVVGMDFASCYELIDHEDLRQELLLRSLDLDTVDDLGELLGGMGHRGRGLPQMLHPSDLLADTYLSVLDRRLARKGYAANRYADDIRVLAQSWEEANEVLDLAAEMARTLGLVLSSQKTKIWLTESLKEQESARLEVLNEYFAQVQDDLTELFFDPYGDATGVSLPPESEVYLAACRRLIADWGDAFRANPHETQLAQLKWHVGFALAGLARNGIDLDWAVLDDLIFDDPTRTEKVCKYLVALHQEGSKAQQTRALFLQLTELRRQGPWTKLWILHVAEAFGSGPRAILKAALPWIAEQLKDRHEVARAQAAWVLANRGELTTEQLEAAYAVATDVSAPALAAAAAKQIASGEQGSPELRPLAAAIRNDSKLNQEAYRWAQ